MNMNRTVSVLKKYTVNRENKQTDKGTCEDRERKGQEGPPRRVIYELTSEKHKVLKKEKKYIYIERDIDIHSYGIIETPLTTLLYSIQLIKQHLSFLLKNLLADTHNTLNAVHV